MPRIRTIKPEFPHSESMGRISRDARLTFILLWTLADDSGRLRGNSRMLASLLLPYDEDSRIVIPACLEELEREKCIVRYKNDDGHEYVSICKWEEHQKIDKPSKSKLPEPPSRTFANTREDSPSPREHSSEDQGSRIKDQGRDQGSLSGGLAKEKETSPLLEDELFKETWKRWESHRLSVGKRIGPVEAESQLMELARHGVEQAVSMIDFSIRCGAKNLITNGDHKGKANGGAGPERKTRGQLAEEVFSR